MSFCLPQNKHISVLLPSIDGVVHKLEVEEPTLVADVALVFVQQNYFVFYLLRYYNSFALCRSYFQKSKYRVRNNWKKSFWKLFEANMWTIFIFLGSPETLRDILYLFKYSLTIQKKIFRV